MSLIEYAKDKNRDIVMMERLIKNFKNTSDNLQLIQLLEFMGERINVLTNKSLVNSPDKVKQNNKEKSVEQSNFQIKSFKITTSKLYLIMDKNEALEAKTVIENKDIEN